MNGFILLILRFVPKNWGTGVNPVLKNQKLINKNTIDDAYICNL